MSGEARVLRVPRGLTYIKFLYKFLINIRGEFQYMYRITSSKYTLLLFSVPKDLMTYKFPPIDLIFEFPPV